MDAILSSIKSGTLRNANPCIVISNKPETQGLKIASEKYGVNTEVIPSDGLKGWDYDEKVVATLHQHGLTLQLGLVSLAGVMRIMSQELVRHYKMRIMNIHPALLPAFP